MKSAFRLGLVALLTVAAVIAVQWKKHQVKTERSKEVKTVLSELLKDGAAVKVTTMERKDLPLRKTLTLTPCGEFYCFDLSRNELRVIKTGRTVHTFDEGKELGEVISVSKKPNYANGLYTAKVKKFAEDTNAVLENRFLARIEIGKKKNVFALPITSVVFENGKYHVYTVDSEGKARLTAVELGESNGTEYFVKEGLEQGQLVVTEGASLIPRFQKVHVISEEVGS